MTGSMGLHGVDGVVGGSGFVTGSGIDGRLAGLPLLNEVDVEAAPKNGTLEKSNDITGAVAVIFAGAESTRVNLGRLLVLE